MSTFKELLGTDNKKEQEERIKELLLKEANPSVTLTVNYSGLSDTVSVSLSESIPFDTVHRMLNLTSKTIRQQETTAALMKLQEEIDQERE